MGVTRSTRRSFPFFRRELRVTLNQLESPNSLRVLAKDIAGFFKPEISNILEIDKQQSLKNLRGRPEVLEGAEVGREVLLKIQGRTTSEYSQEKISVEATLETKFKEFSEGAIFYNLLSTFPDGLVVSDISSLIVSNEVELTKLEIGLDYFENREFNFLGIKLQELRERFYISFVPKVSGKGSELNGMIENNNLQLSNGFSAKIREKIGFLAQITGIPLLAKEIND